MIKGGPYGPPFVLWHGALRFEGRVRAKALRVWFGRRVPRGIEVRFLFEEAEVPFLAELE